jgi:hypothetical protein
VLALAWLTLLALPELGCLPLGWHAAVAQGGRASLVTLALELLTISKTFHPPACPSRPPSVGMRAPVDARPRGRLFETRDRSMMAGMAASPICPTCGSAAVPLLLGLAAPAASEAAKAGVLALGGCFANDDGTDPNWRCTARGHHWRDDDQARWQATLEAALAGRPHCPRCGSASRMRIDASVAEWYERELRSGQAVVVEPAPPGREHEYLACGHLWVPR